MTNKQKVLDQLRGGETVITVIAEKSGLTEDQVRNAIRGLQQFDDMNIVISGRPFYVVAWEGLNYKLTVHSQEDLDFLTERARRKVTTPSGGKVPASLQVTGLDRVDGSVRALVAVHPFVSRFGAPESAKNLRYAAYSERNQRVYARLQSIADEASDSPDKGRGGCTHWGKVELSAIADWIENTYEGNAEGF